MKTVKNFVVAIMLALTLAFTAVAQSSNDFQGKPPERPREKEKDPPKRETPKPSDDKKDKKRKPDFIF